MRIVCFNINGVRARPHQLASIVERHQPAIIGLQETKVQDAQFPHEIVAGLGYQASVHGQKGHYGVALLSREAPESVRYGLPGDDDQSQRRLIAASYRLADGSALQVINGYYPQGEGRDHPTKFPAKRDFYAAVRAELENRYRPDEALILMGDFNVAPEDADIGIGPDNAKRWLRDGKCSFLPEERDWYRHLMDWGLIDCFRHVHPTAQGLYSWFDYRSRGFERDPPRGLRIDTLLATPPVVRRLRDAGIDYVVRGMEKPSDHCPVWIELD